MRSRFLALLIVSLSLVARAQTPPVSTGSNPLASSPAITISSLNPNGATLTHLYVDHVKYQTAQAAIAACPTVGCIVTDYFPENLTAGSIQPFCSGTWSPLTPATCTGGTWKTAYLELGYGNFTTDYTIFYGSAYERIIGPSVSVGQGNTVTGAIITASAAWDQTGPDAGHPILRMSPLFTGSNYKFGNVIANVTLDCTTAATAGKVCEHIVNDGADEHTLVEDVRMLAPKPPTATSATTALTRAGCPGACVVTVTEAAITGCTTGCVLNNGQQIIIAGTTSAVDSFNGTFTVASHTEVAGITTSFTYNQSGVTTNESATGQGTIRVAGEFVGWFGNGAQNSKMVDLELGCGVTGFQDANTNGIVIASYSLRVLSGLTFVCGNGTTPLNGVLVTGSTTDPLILSPHYEGLTHDTAFVNSAGGFLVNSTTSNQSSGDAVCICDSTVKAVDVFDININVAGTLSVLSDQTFSPTFTAATSVAHMGYYLLGLTTGNTHTYWSDLKSFPDPQSAFSLIEQAAPTIQAITGLNQGAVWNDSTAHRLKFCYGNGNCLNTDTFVGIATPDAFTNKTFDASATGNVFRFKQDNPQTTTYQALAADFSSCKTITVASGTFTVTLVASGSQPLSGQCIWVMNYGSGVVTIAPSGQNINGAGASIVVPVGSSASPSAAYVHSNGTNYFAQIFPSEQLPGTENSASGTAYTVTGTGITSLTTAGAIGCFVPSVANGGSGTTVSFNGLTAKIIVKNPNNAAVAANDMVTTQPACMFYNGTNFVLLNPQGTTGSGKTVLQNNPTFTQGFAAGGTATGANTVRLTADSAGITATTPGTTFLTFPTLVANNNYSFTCEILYSQATAAVLDGFSVQAATNAATRWDAWGTMDTTNPVSTTVTASKGSALNVTTTTSTPVVSATPGATATVFQATLRGSIQVGASVPTVNVAAFTGNASDAVTIKAGTFCSVHL